jgi:hypothetical protein
MRRSSLYNEVDALLKAAAVSVVDVHEAAKVVVTKPGQRDFDFVAYAKRGDAWMILCGPRNTRNLAFMADWQRIFGKGFAIRFAVRRAGKLQFLDERGHAHGIWELTGETPAFMPVTPSHRGLFGQRVYPAATGAQQPMFLDETPLTNGLPELSAVDRRIVRQYSDVAATGQLFTETPT